MIPSYTLSVNGSDVTSNFSDRVISISVVDNEGSDSDTCSVVIDDRGGMIMIPATGDLLEISMGYIGALVPMGTFKIADPEVTGWPLTLTLNGTSADMKDKFKEHRDQDYHDKTIKQIVGEIAKRHGLQPLVVGEIANFKYKGLMQLGESDMSFLTRLGKKHDAIASPKGGKLIFVKKGELDLGTVQIVKENVLDFRWVEKDRPKHGKTAASHWDRDKGEKVVEETSSGKGPKYTVNGVQTEGKAEAKEVSKSKGTALNRDKENIDLTVVGNAEIAAEMKLNVQGIRDKVDGEYRIKNATHAYEESGYTTKITGELTNGN